MRRADPLDAGHRNFPGGKIKHGKTATQTALRALSKKISVTAVVSRALKAVSELNIRLAGNG
ncbi:NUDIX hydrolase [Roseovarius sp. MMSF_3281]|uniref:NUDIX hydrolase n=1 Tax=Roseovarius sp. MMSF_3281 TaxID=3046694 RepID=UPI00273DCCC4|nr:hypothetical protein [Roseovarius sp. MMSF_3281]